MKLLLQNAHVIDPANAMDRIADIAIADGRVVAVGSTPADFTPERIVDVSGLVAAPGLVELSARLREPGQEYRATLESEMQAALHGGVTTLSCPPDTDPPLDEPGLVEMLKFRAQALNQAHVYPQGALTIGLQGAIITEMNELTDAGCIGFGQAECPIENTQVLLRAMQYAHTFGYVVWLRPQDPWLGRGGVAHAGPVAARLGLSGVSSAAESVALHTIFELVRMTGCKVHLCRLSSAQGIALLREAKREGLPITADVSINHVHLIDIDIGYFDPMKRLIPPLRAQRDRDAIRAGLADGTIDAITSDHCPVDDDEKLLPFDQASPGATGLELLLPLALKWADECGLSPARAIEKIALAPARILGSGGIHVQAGSLALGMPADLCLYDPHARWRVEPRALASQGKNTPFLGMELQGQARYTIVGGHIAYEATKEFAA
ncbi:MAG TPA: dihydroorotase [Burkholderiaceae bacterium]|nr:dihydroorotase [Burkholderiaceae bacterium]